MTFIADEGVDSAVVAILRGVGHDVFYDAEAAPGLADAEVLELANVQNALLLTADKDFGELVFRLGRVHTGVILLRLMGLASDTQADIVAEVVKRYGVQMRGAFTVIAPKTVRCGYDLNPAPKPFAVGRATEGWTKWLTITR